MLFPNLTLLKLVGVAVLVVTTSVITHRYDKGQQALELQAQREELLNKNEVLEDQIQQLTLDYIAQSEKVRIVTKEIIKEIPKAVTNETDKLYPLSNGFVRMHDSAASGVFISEDSTGVDANPSKIKESRAAEVITENYESCNITREKLIALQSIVKELLKK